MLLKIYPDNPAPRHIKQVVDTLRGGGVIIVPTDTIYAYACDITNQKAIERLSQIKGITLEKANFSFICADLSNLSDYSQQINNNIFKIMKKALPGPFTFILNANSNVPKIFRNKKKTIGIRVPDNNICMEIVKELGNPIMSSSVHDDDDVVEYTTDPELIHEKNSHLVDIVIDGGYGHNIASTVIDCTGAEPIVIRDGSGEIDNLF
jgi:tRNA threonylcarbamoyl adenosine modification protein (Sua5/YciO/YrdC/YwlC family)